MKSRLIDLLLSKQDGMRKRAVYLCNNIADAEDLLNDANYKILLMIEKGVFINENSFSEYFYQTVNSVFIDKKRKRRIVTTEIKTDSIKDSESTDYITISIDEIINHAKIPISAKPIIELFLFDENMYNYSIKNNINPNTIRSIINRAKISLRNKKHLFESLKDGFDLCI